jgi:hypothetical protein
VLTSDRGLLPWLDRLRSLAASGDVGRAADGLAHWRTIADATQAAAQQVATANALPAAQRRELRGLLRAARAKGLAAGRGDDLALRGMEQAARVALEAPCDLAAAQSLVAAYVAALRPTRRPSRGKESA